MGNIGRAVLTVFLVLVIAGTLAGGAMAVYIINCVTPQDFDLSSTNLDSTTLIYANDGKTNSAVSGEQNRIWVPISSMPDNLKNAFICTEDQRFYEHNGVDWKRTVSSFGNLFLHFYGTKQGGSTNYPTTCQQSHLSRQKQQRLLTQNSGNCKRYGT